MKLLLVEDDRRVAALVRCALREEGHTVDFATSVAHGRVLALVHEYDAIVLAIGLADGSGLDIVRLLRRTGRTMPVIVLTRDNNAAEDVVEGLDAGADDFLAKPFDVAVLRARLRALLRRVGAAVTTASFGGVTLDHRRREAILEGRRLRLTPKEFLLLEFLLVRAEELVTHAELLENVWDMNFDPGSNVVDVHIARLRSKLRHFGARPHLVTVRGFGFLLTLDSDDAAEFVSDRRAQIA